jgi:hypothetical protein
MNFGKIYHYAQIYKPFRLAPVVLSTNDLNCNFFHSAFSYLCTLKPTTMKVNQQLFNNREEALTGLRNLNASEYELHFLFADKIYLEDAEILKQIHETFKGTVLGGCSSSGEIGDKKFAEKSMVVTSVKLEKSCVKKACYRLKDVSDSRKAGEQIANELKGEGLKHIYIISDGITVNGTRLIEGINSVYDKGVNVSGGLAGDNAAFIKTYVADMENNFVSDIVTAIGFYGDAIQTGCGSFGGWDSFGIDRVVTKSKENVVYEIDGQPALDLYKSYLGDMSNELPGSALFFPLEMRTSEDSELLVRTILGVNEEEKSMTFAGNLPEGAFVRLMKTNVNRVIDGAGKASGLVKESVDKEAQLLLMVSCVGRKLVLKQLVQDEVEAVTENFSQDTVFTGFYSNGEIAKMHFHDNCNLHNQTMTITSISEG